MASTRVEYSVMEKRLLALLPGDGSRITSDELARKHYGRRKPVHARGSVVSLMRGLVRKARLNGIIIGRSERRGPHPMEFWIERKSGDGKKAAA